MARRHTVVDAPNLIMSRKNRIGKRTDSTTWNIQYEELDDFEPWLDAVWLCHMLSENILRHLRKSVLAGVHPGTGVLQPPLDAKGVSGKAAKKGWRPNIRGVTTGTKSKGHFYNHIQRGKIRHTAKPVKVATRNKTAIFGTRATTKIQPHPQHRGFVAVEADQRRIEYFDVPDSLVDWVLKTFLTRALKGPPNKNILNEIGLLESEDAGR